MTTPDPAQGGPDPLLSLRSAVVLLLGVLSGLATAALTYLSGSDAAASALAALGAAGAAIAFFHSIIG